VTSANASWSVAGRKLHGDAARRFQDHKDSPRPAGIVTSDHEDMHAGELETSILLHGCPELVRDGYTTSDHIANLRADLLTVGMEAYTSSGVIGRPSLGSALKGKAAVASLVESFAHCLETLG
jgi:creatinine amidohydrolase